jgi:hypothetical protein
MKPFNYRVCVEIYIETFNLGWVSSTHDCITPEEAKAHVVRFMKFEKVRNLRIELI